MTFPLRSNTFLARSVKSSNRNRCGNCDDFLELGVEYVLVGQII